MTTPRTWFITGAGRGLGVGLEFADGRVPFAKSVEELDAHRLGEHPEALGDQVHERVGQRMRERLLS